MSLQKNVLVTGGSRGIGRACALEFGKNGYRVAINYAENDAAAKNTLAELRSLGVDAAIFKADVSRGLEVERMFDEIERDFGKIDTLVCNAGVAWVGLFTDMTDENWRKLFGVNVDGCFYCCRRALKNMIHEKQGNIITISSMWGEVGGSCEVGYSATKSAIIGMTKALAKEVAPSGIRVNCISPGVIDTEMNGNLSPADMTALCEETPLERIGKAEDIAAAAVFLASDKSSFITGQVLSVNGGIVI